jgi:hypothetical protein
MARIVLKTFPEQLIQAFDLFLSFDDPTAQTSQIWDAWKTSPPPLLQTPELTADNPISAPYQRTSSEKTGKLWHPRLVSQFVIVQCKRVTAVLMSAKKFLELQERVMSRRNTMDSGCKYTLISVLLGMSKLRFLERIERIGQSIGQN